MVMEKMIIGQVLCIPHYVLETWNPFEANRIDSSLLRDTYVCAFAVLTAFWQIYQIIYANHLAII